MITLITIIVLIALIIALSVWNRVLKTRLSWAKKVAEMAWDSARKDGNAVQVKQAELAKAQKRVKRLERTLEKNNLAHLS